MKTYFAKLAARATLANAPVSGAVSVRGAPRDPFDDNPAPPNVTSPLDLGQSSHSNHQSMGRVALESSPKGVARRRAETENVDIPSPKVSKRLNPSPAETQPSRVVADRLSDAAATLDVPKTEKRSRAGSQDPKVPPSSGATGLLPRTEEAPHVVSVSSKEKEKLPARAQEQTNEHLAEIQKEQSILLRKADAFMAGLFDRRQRATTREDADSEDEHQTVPERSESPRQPATRLQPLVSPTRVSEPADEGPSLVIGKLSVEVLPPAAPPVASQRQVVVINAGQRTRAGIPSSQRFGFSRF